MADSLYHVELNGLELGSTAESIGTDFLDIVLGHLEGSVGLGSGICHHGRGVLGEEDVVKCDVDRTSCGSELGECLAVGKGAIADGSDVLAGIE